jgi:hypothetical protein
MAPRSPARVLAPLALAVFVLAVLVVLATTGGRGHSRNVRRAGSPLAGASGVQPRQCRRVKRGELLSTIALKTGISVQRLRQLNPDLDPQALRAGQKIRIRPGTGRCGHSASTGPRG